MRRLPSLHCRPLTPGGRTRRVHSAISPNDPMISNAAVSGMTDDEKIRRLPWAFGHIATNTVFGSLTVFGTVFILFLTELGLD